MLSNSHILCANTGDIIKSFEHMFSTNQYLYEIITQRSGIWNCPFNGLYKKREQHVSGPVLVMPDW